MADNVQITPGTGTSVATDDVAGVQYQRVKVCFGPDGSAADTSSTNPMPVTISGTLTTNANITNVSIPVTGTFWQATQPVSIAATVNTNITNASIPVTGTFWQATQPISGTVAVSNFPATQAVSIATMPTTPVTGTFWQATQPVSIAATVNVSAVQSGTWNVGTLTSITNPVAVTAPTVTKGIQGANGFTVQDLKDSGRSYKVFSATFSAATTEAMVTLTPITDGVAGSTGTSFTVTNGKRFRIQSLSVTTRNAGAAVQGVVVNLRSNTGGATTATSALLLTTGCGTLSATANISASGFCDIPDGLEIAGNGTITFGISQVGTATAGNTVTLIGYEY